MTPDEYVKKYINDAKYASSQTGIPAILILAQSAIESGWGADGIATKYNNFFGIKKHNNDGWVGETVVLSSPEEVNGVKKNKESTFRVYNSPSQSFIDWVNFLKANPRYEKNGVFDGGTAQDVAKALAKAGYATDSKYEQLLNDVIKTVGKTEYYSAFGDTSLTDTQKQQYSSTIQPPKFDGITSSPVDNMLDDQLSKFFPDLNISDEDKKAYYQSLATDALRTKNSDSAFKRFLNKLYGDPTDWGKDWESSKDHFSSAGDASKFIVNSESADWNKFIVEGLTDDSGVSGAVKRNYSNLVVIGLIALCVIIIIVIILGQLKGGNNNGFTNVQTDANL